jgi:hypothetical protein
MKFPSIIVTLIILILSSFNYSFAEIFYEYTSLTFEKFKFDETGVKFYRYGDLVQEYHYLPLSPYHFTQTADSKPIALIKLDKRESGFCMIFKYKSKSSLRKFNSEKFFDIQKWKMAKIELNLINIINDLQKDNNGQDRRLQNQTRLKNKLEDYLMFDFYKEVSPWYYGKGKIDIQHSFYLTNEALIILTDNVHGDYLETLKTIYEENCYKSESGHLACKFNHEVVSNVYITIVIPGKSRSRMYNIEFLFKGENEEEAPENRSYRIFQTPATEDVKNFIEYLKYLYGNRVKETRDKNEVDPDTIPFMLIE